MTVLIAKVATFNVFLLFFTHQVPELKFEITKFFFGEEKTYQEKTTDNI